MDKWLTVQELLGLETLPSSDRGITKKSQRENWIKRQRDGVKGKTFEYAFTSLPQAVQAELLLKNAREKLGGLSAPTRGIAYKNYLPEVIWAPFDKATEKQREDAKHKLELVVAVADLKANGMPLMESLAFVAKQRNEHIGSLKRWYYKVRSFERSDWLPLLLDKHNSQRTGARAEFTEAAWDFFKADYFRNERPQFGSCYERLKRAAREQDWVIPSASSIKRKIQREIPKVQQVYLRDGENALSQYYPAMQRSVADLEAMEWINGDGYQHNVFVQWHNGDIVRPKTWIWQDIRTRKILAYRVDLSENSDSIRLSLMDLIWKYGIPKKCTIDNTRAAANKWMTGGVKNRYRFKVKEDEVTGIIPLLGIELHWTSIQFGKGHGQAKPIERAFSHGGLGELIDKHPKLAGFYTGSGVEDQPDIHYERSFFNRVNGELCIYNTIEIIKRYQPKVYVIENPLASRMWDYISEVIGFDIPFDNPTYYGNYNYPVKKPTKFKSNIDLGLKYQNYYAGNRMNDVLRSYNAKSNIPMNLLNDMYRKILAYLDGWNG